jgi:hypothetical protein
LPSTILVLKSSKTTQHAPTVTHAFITANMPGNNIQTLLNTSTELHKQVTQLCNELSALSLSQATLSHPLDGNTNTGGCANEVTAELDSLWRARDGQDPIEKAKANIVGLAQRLESLTLGPQGFIHELVSLNWEHGALYVLLEHGVLDTIPRDGGSRKLREIAALTGLQPEKLLPICRLLACSGIISEPEPESFGHTFISAALSANNGFSSWVGFQ